MFTSYDTFTLTGSESDSKLRRCIFAFTFSQCECCFGNMFYLRSNENNSRGTFTLNESENFLLTFATTQYEKQVEFPMNLHRSDFVS